MLIPTNPELGDEYFSFADSVNAAAATRSAAAAALEAEMMAELQAEADVRGVILGWLLRDGCCDTLGSDSSERRGLRGRGRRGRRRRRLP